jgi:hypothetical protein
MRMRFERPATVPVWVAEVALCFVAALGLVAIARSIPVSYAGIPDGGAPSAYPAAVSGSEDAQGPLAAAKPSIDARRRSSCTGCGVVESMRRVAGPGTAASRRAGRVDVAAGVSGGQSANAIAEDATATEGYEITVRLRDGSTTVFNEATPRAWRPGSRVVVIAGLQVANR